LLATAVNKTNYVTDWTIISFWCFALWCCINSQNFS